MKKSSNKKGFSLIELIVVIAVIAAIAAVIVPSITNFSSEAKKTADKRNVQLWNQVYLEAKAAGATGLNTNIGAVTRNSNVPAINAYTTLGVGNTNVTFSSPSFTLTFGGCTWDTNNGLSYTPASGN
jgi:type IV pilus assembly protein PilA